MCGPEIGKPCPCVVPRETTERWLARSFLDPKGSRVLSVPAHVRSSPDGRGRIVTPASASVVRRRGSWDRLAAVWRAGAWLARERGSWSDVPFGRMGHCGRLVVSDEDGVNIHVTTNDDGARRAYPVGVAACGSVWACPRCAPTIRARRAAEVNEAAAKWVSSADGRYVALVTLTIRHHRGDDLVQLLDGLAKSWKNLQQRQDWRSLRKAGGLRGMIRSMEITEGPNGYHPHVHAVVFMEAGSSLRRVHEVIGRHWPEVVSRRLGDAHTPSTSIGVDVRKIPADQAGYVCGHEISSGVKSSDAMYSITSALAAGEVGALARFCEFFTATKGRNFLVWSPGLRKMLGMGEELSDEEQALQLVGDSVNEYEVPGRVWRLWCRDGTVARRLEALEDGHVLGGILDVTPSRDPIGGDP